MDWNDIVIVFRKIQRFDMAGREQAKIPDRNRRSESMGETVFSVQKIYSCSTQKKLDSLTGKRVSLFTKDAVRDSIVIEQLPGQVFLAAGYDIRKFILFKIGNQISEKMNMCGMTNVKQEFPSLRALSFPPKSHQ